MKVVERRSRRAKGNARYQAPRKPAAKLRLGVLQSQSDDRIDPRGQRRRLDDDHRLRRGWIAQNGSEEQSTDPLARRGGRSAPRSLRASPRAVGPVPCSKPLGPCSRGRTGARGTRLWRQTAQPPITAVQVAAAADSWRGPRPRSARALDTADRAQPGATAQASDPGPHSSVATPTPSRPHSDTDAARRPQSGTGTQDAPLRDLIRARLCLRTWTMG